MQDDKGRERKTSFLAGGIRGEKSKESCEGVGRAVERSWKCLVELPLCIPSGGELLEGEVTTPDKAREN
jgi:hypothetical protein